VPLRDIDEFHRWVERESPSVTAQRVARNFLAEVGDEARPVQIWYQHIYATDAVNIIAVTNQ
jgi:hypothetical protein